jgi:hypothetical protein
MKRIGHFVFLLLPTAAFGQSGRSHIGPFSRPLDFIVTVNGIDSIWEGEYYGNTIEPSSFQLEWNMNPADSGYILSGDTISYYSQEAGTSLGSGIYSYISWFTLIFDSSNKTISSVSFGYQQYFQVVYGAGNTENIEDNSLTDSVWLANFSYDSSLIHTTDSTLLFHHGGANYNFGESPQFSFPYLPTESETLISVSSMTLSGSFDSITLTATSGVTMPVVSPSGMSVNYYNGTIQCVFPSSDDARTLELYTPLGVRAASIEIPAGQSGISLPQLMSGLYFVRMDGNVIKVAIP